MLAVEDGAIIRAVNLNQLSAYLADPICLIRAFCLVSIAAICIARFVPASQQRFLNYGARGHSAQPSTGECSTNAHGITKLLDWLASFDVPHGWFAHFYVLSLVSSVFWLTQVTLQTKFLWVISESVTHQSRATSKEATLTAIILMIVQSARRLRETLVFSKGSHSRMWIGHYVFGLAFYCVANIATWVESVHVLTKSDQTQHHWMSLLFAPYFAFGLSIFVMSSSLQQVAHAHLARLPKYSIPRHWVFENVICPHYTAECFIYFSLAIIAAPAQKRFNESLLWITLLTTINLGITAHSTKTWMMGKFRESQNDIQKKWCMLPGIW